MMRHKYFPISGAGKIKLSHSRNASCGGAVGFTFGVSWTDYPYIGGVLDQEDAEKLAHFILKKLKKK